MNRKRWDDISSDYDQSVENNGDSVISNYLQAEMTIVTNLCKQIIRKYKNRCSIIDMGSGTGRVIFSLNKAINDKSVLFYGLDTSENMINKANKKKLL